MAQHKAKKQIVYIHGGQSFSEYTHFLEYLKTVPLRDPLARPPVRWKDTLPETFGLDVEVYMPSMPNKQNARYEEWKIWFERHIPLLRDDVVLVGHSQGGYFLARYFSEHAFPLKVKALYLLAAPAGPDDFGGEDGGDFAFDMAKFCRGVADIPHVYVFHSKDDKVVPFAHAERYQKGCPKVELIPFEHKGHFLMETFPEFVESVRGLFGKVFIEPSL